MGKKEKTTEDMESVGYGYGEEEEKKKKKGKAEVYAGKKKPLKGKDRKKAARKLLEKVTNKEK